VNELSFLLGKVFFGGLVAFSRQEPGVQAPSEVKSYGWRLAPPGRCLALFVEPVLR
jgi:hypothetical protein